MLDTAGKAIAQRQLQSRPCACLRRSGDDSEGGQVPSCTLKQAQRHYPGVGGEVLLHEGRLHWPLNIVNKDSHRLLRCMGGRRGRGRLGAARERISRLRASRR